MSRLRTLFFLIPIVVASLTSLPSKVGYAQRKGDMVIALQRLRLVEKGKFVLTVMEGERMLVEGQTGDRTRVRVLGKVGSVETRMLHVDRFASARRELVNKLRKLQKKPSAKVQQAQVEQVRWKERLTSLYEREVSEKRNLHHAAVDQASRARKRYTDLKSALDKKVDVMYRHAAYHNSEIELSKRARKSLDRTRQSYDAAVKSFNARIKANDRAIRIHNSKRNLKRTRAEVEKYNREAERGNKLTRDLLRESSRLNERFGKLSVRRAKRNAESDRLNHQRLRGNREFADYFDFDVPKRRQLARAADLATQAVGRAERELAFMYGDWAWAWRQIGEYERSLQDSLQLRRLRPRLPQSYFCNALVRLQQKRPFLAVQQLNEALALAPNNPRLLYWRSHAWRQLGQTKRAKLDYFQYLERNSGKPLSESKRQEAAQFVEKNTLDVQVSKRNLSSKRNAPPIDFNLSKTGLLELAKDLIAQRKFSDAAEACNRLIAKDENSSIAFSLRGLAITAAGQTDPDPADDFEKARKLSPTTNLTHLHLGFALGIRGQLEKTFEEFQLGLRKNPKRFVHLQELGTKWIDANPSDHFGYFVQACADQLGRKYTTSASVLYLESFRLRPSVFIQLRLADNWKKRRPRRALLEITDVIHLGSKNAAALLLRAELYLQLKQFTNAIKDTTTALKISESVTAYALRAEARLAQREYRQAKEDCDRAIQLSPGDPRAYFTRGKLLAAQDRNASALGDYSKAIQRSPKSPDMLLARGQAYRKINRYADAVADLSAAIRLRYGFQEAYFERGVANASLGNYAQAISDLKRVIRRDSTHSEAHRQLAWIYATASDARWRHGYDAIKHARRACQLTNYLDPRCFEALAAGRAEMGVFKVAAETQKFAIKLYKSSSDRVAARRILSRYEQSKRHYQSPKSKTVPQHLRGKSSYALRNLGRDLIRKKKYSQAIEALTESIRRSRVNPEAHFHRGRANDSLKKRRLAIADYTMAIRYDPKHQIAFYNRAILHNEMGRSDLAIRDYDQSISLNPKHFRSFYGRGYTWNGLKLYGRAKEDYEAAIKVNSRHLNSRMALASLLANCSEAKLRDGSQAILHARKACTQTSWNDSGPLAILANAYATAGQFEAAKKWQKEAIKKKSGYKYSLTSRLKLYEARKSFFLTGGTAKIDGISLYAFRQLVSRKRRRGRFQSALYDYQRLISVNPKSTSYYLELRAETHREQGHLPAALAELARAKQLSPNRTTPYLERAKIFRELKKYGEAIKEYTELIKLRPTYSSVLRERATTYGLAGKHELALADVNQLINKKKRSSTLYSLRAQLHRDMGSFNQALNDYKKALDLSSSSIAKRNSLAWFLATCPDKSIRDGKRAVIHALKACAGGNWSHPGRLDTLAAAYAAGGQFSRAVYWQKRAIELAETGRGSLGLTDARKRLKRFLAGKHYETNSDD